METEATGDQERSKPSSVQRSFRRWLVFAGVLGAMMLSLAITNVWLHIHFVQDGYRLAGLQAEHEQLLTVSRKLRLEWSQLCDPSYLEKLGSEKHGLAAPKPNQKLILR